MPESIYETVLDLLQVGLPQGWTKVLFYAEYHIGSYSMQYYVQTGQNAFYDCFSLSGLSKETLYMIFLRIDGVLAPERKKLPAKNQWSNMTIEYKDTGKFKVEFCYDDLSNASVGHFAKWKQDHDV